MRIIKRDKHILTVSQIPDSYTLVQTDTEANAITEYIGLDEENAYPYYFVLTGDGDYVDVWGCCSLRLMALATRVWLDGELLI